MRGNFSIILKEKSCQMRVITSGIRLYKGGFFGISARIFCIRERNYRVKYLCFDMTKKKSRIRGGPGYPQRPGLPGKPIPYDFRTRVIKSAMRIIASPMPVNRNVPESLTGDCAGGIRDCEYAIIAGSQVNRARNVSTAGETFTDIRTVPEVLSIRLTVWISG
jgi:hypothetical protein